MCRKMVYLVFVVLVFSLAVDSSAELVGYWKFDEGSGAITRDVTGNGNEGALQGNPQWVAGKYFHALEFDGSRVAIPASDSLTANLFQGSFTLSAWTNPSRTGNTWQQIFRSSREDENPNDTLFFNNDGRLSWRGFVGGSWAGDMCETAPGVVPADQWTHVAVTGDGINFRIYVNGVLSQESAFQTTDGSNATYYIGGSPIWLGESYTGILDDVRIYMRGLTQEEVQHAMDDLVYFPDPNLEVVVEEALGIQDPTPDDMLALDQLHASERGIVNLTGIEYATNLWLAELLDNQISDISPLSNLINLTCLNIERNQIVDLSPLSNLTNLTELVCGKNQISDVRPLAGLDNLKLLFLDGNLISDVCPLSALTTNLDSLYLQFNQISDVSSLASLTNLSHLSLYSNQISDVTPLSELINLTSLHLARTQVTDLTPLAGLTNLTWLYLYGNQISDISTLSGLTNLMELQLTENQISDISPLTGLTNLTVLQLQSNPLDWLAYYVDIPLIVANNPNLKPENFYYDHKIAYDPYPPDGAMSMDPNVILSWMPSMTGELHDVYFGDNFADVNDGVGDTFRGNQAETSFVVGLPGSPYPDGLVPGATYYWRIDEHNAEGTVAKGQVWSFNGAGPLEETVEYQVSAKEDDGYAFNENFQIADGASLKIGSSSFAQLPYYTSGMVFRNVNIPQGTEIVSAHLRIRSYNSRLSDVVYGTIQAEASDDAVGIGAFGNVGTLPKTNASVDWDLIEPWLVDTWYTSPDIAGVVQEVIDRGGWSADNSLAVIYSTRLREGGYRNISSFDRGSDSAPILEITYRP